MDENENTNLINIIMRQTDYDVITAQRKLEYFNNDHIKVIKDFFKITEKKEPAIISINQGIYKQIRTKLNSSIKTYNDSQYIKLEQEIQQNK